MNFITELELLVSKNKLEKPYVMLFAGDFNAHSKSWYADGDTNSEGIQLDTLFSDLGLSQLISEPTHTRENCNPTCIDLILTDQPNLIMEPGVRPSLDPSCKHQITLCKLNLKIPPLRPFKRHTWQFDKAERVLIERSMSEFQWESVLTQNTDPDSQVDILNSTLLNIMSNFVLNFKVNVKPNAPKWITRDIKNLMRRQNKLYKKYKRNGFIPDDKVRVDTFRNECFQAINKSKHNYLNNLGNQLTDNSTGQKTQSTR